MQFAIRTDVWCHRHNRRTLNAPESAPPPVQPNLIHAVSRLRTSRLARSSKPFLARRGSRLERCPGCRLPLAYCLCSWRPVVQTRAGFCLLMGDIEPLKPSNTGWLVADVVPDTFAFGWHRTTVDPGLLALLSDPQWRPYVVFPGEFVDAARVVSSLEPPLGSADRLGIATAGAPTDTHTPRPLFILLDATWPEATKMFRKSPYLDRLPVLSLQSEQVSAYQLRRSQRNNHFCTSEVATLCLALAGETLAAQTLQAYLGVFTHHYLRARQQAQIDPHDSALVRLAGLRQTRLKTPVAGV